MGSGDSILPEDLFADPASSKVEIWAHEASLKSWKNQASELICSMCDDEPAEGVEDENVAMNRSSKLKTDYTN